MTTAAKPRTSKPKAKKADAEARTSEIRDKLGDRAHRDGCPSIDGDGMSRVEAYPEIRPAKPDAGVPAKEITVLHCIDCGATKVIDKAYDAVFTDDE